MGVGSLPSFSAPSLPSSSCSTLHAAHSTRAFFSKVGFCAWLRLGFPHPTPCSSIAPIPALPPPTIRPYNSPWTPSGRPMYRARPAPQRTSPLSFLCSSRAWPRAPPSRPTTSSPLSRHPTASIGHPDGRPRTSKTTFPAHNDPPRISRSARTSTNRSNPCHSQSGLPSLSPSCSPVPPLQSRSLRDTSPSPASASALSLLLALAASNAAFPCTTLVSPWL